MTNPPPPPPPTGQPGWNGPQQGYGGPSYATGGGMQNGMGVAALILGLLAVLLGVFVIGGLLGALAVGLGFAGRSRAKKGLADNKGMATFGILAGLVGMLLAVAVVATIVVVGWDFWHSKTIKDIRQCASTHLTSTQTTDCENKFGITPPTSAS